MEALLESKFAIYDDHQQTLTFKVRRAYYETCSDFNNNPQQGKLGFLIKINYAFKFKKCKYF